MYRANRKAISKQVRVGADKHSSIPDDRNQVHAPETVTTQTESCLPAMFPYNDQQMDEVTDSSSDDEFNPDVSLPQLTDTSMDICFKSTSNLQLSGCPLLHSTVSSHTVHTGKVHSQNLTVESDTHDGISQ